MGLTHSPKIATQNLLLYIDVANRKSYPGSGNNITNLSSNNLITVQLSNTSVSGSKTNPVVTNGVVPLDGVQQYIETTHVQTSVTAYSVDVWFKTSTTSLQRTWVQNRGTGAGVSITCGIGPAQGTAGKVFIAIDTEGIIMQKGTVQSYNDDTWHNAVCIFNQSSGTITTDSFNIYIDGQQADTTTSGMQQFNNTTAPVTGLGNTRIGWHQSWGTYFTGSLGPVKIYDRALTADEVSQNFNSLRGRFGI